MAVHTIDNMQFLSFIPCINQPLSLLSSLGNEYRRPMHSGTALQLGR